MYSAQIKVRYQPVGEPHYCNGCNLCAMWGLDFSIPGSILLASIRIVPIHALYGMMAAQVVESTLGSEVTC
jgi:hypothetical protein